jgi:D-beta-D-heptose 7-phosphate kinase/D-beta-D-heptose 1-phosphate adenosyltransferase
LLIVLANTDDFLIKKKGYVYIPQDERLAILHSLSSVDWVIPWNDGTDHVAGALRLIKPDYFFNGGDRSSLDKQHPEEIKACLECGIALKLGIGGDEKCVSSSQITKYFVDNYLTNIIWKQK